MQRSKLRHEIITIVAMVYRNLMAVNASSSALSSQDLQRHVDCLRYIIQYCIRLLFLAPGMCGDILAREVLLLFLSSR